MFSATFSVLIGGSSVGRWDERTGHYQQRKMSSPLKPQIEVNKRTSGGLAKRIWQGRERNDNRLLMDMWHGPKEYNQVNSQISLLSGILFENTNPDRGCT